MSETAHYKGKLTPTGKTIAEYVENDWFQCGDYDNEESYFNDKYYDAAIEVDGQVYEVEKKNIDAFDDIVIATKNEQSGFDFELRYHNGGGSFDEMIKQAIRKHKEDSQV